jgi:hypothetical protein
LPLRACHSQRQSVSQPCFVIPQRNLHPPFALSFRSACFVIPQRSEGICICFSSLPNTTVISTEPGHASSSCAAEKPLYLRVPGTRGKYRGLSTPAANDAASGRDDEFRLSLACHSAALACHSAALACHSAAQRRNLHLPLLPVQHKPSLSTEAGHASSSCAVEKPLYSRVIECTAGSATIILRGLPPLLRATPLASPKHTLPPAAADR